VKWFEVVDVLGNKVYINRDNILLACPRKASRTEEPEAKAKIIGSKGKLITEYFADIVLSTGLAVSQKFNSIEDADKWIRSSVADMADKA